MPSQSDWCISVPEHVSWTTSSGEVLVFNAHTEEICGLDAVAADAFVQLVAHRRLSDAIEALKGIYAIDVETLRRDVASLVRQLEARGLVRVPRRSRAI
jgi:hypothetical protein